MNGKKYCLTLPLFFVFLLGWYSSNAQSRGYIVKGDTVYTDGYIQFDRKQPFKVEFQVSKKTLPEILLAGAVTEFGYRDSTKFVAREVIYFGEKRTVFLETLAAGDLNLYTVRGEDGKQFYFEQNSLTRLTKENLQTHLQQHTANSPTWQRQLPRVKLARQPLSYYTRNINKGRSPKLSTLNFGGFASFNRSTMRMTADAFPENGFGAYSMVSENVEAGAFVEMPVWDLNNFTVTQQLSYGKMAYAATLLSPPLDQHMKLTLDFLKLSVVPRYYLNSHKITFFVEAGPELFYVTEQSSSFMEATHSNNTTTLQEHGHVFMLQKSSFGMMAGTGLQYFYLPKHYINLGLGTGHVFGQGYAITNLSTTIRINL
jgi:hypothetical protein